MQIKLGTFGQIVEGLDDLNQEILLILATPLGSVPHQPELEAVYMNTLTDQ